MLQSIHAIAQKLFSWLVSHTPYFDL